MWKLYVANLLDTGGHKLYIWTEDDIIRHARVIIPVGFADQFQQFIAEFKEKYLGFNIHLESLQEFNFKVKKTKMTQEQLAEGWLLL